MLFSFFVFEKHLSNQKKRLRIATYSTFLLNQKDFLQSI